MQEQVRLMRCCLLDTPMLMGLWRPCILLPEVELEEQQLRYVLLHELSHRRRRDLWLKFLLLVAKAVHWFNPLVWWMARRASADIEVACDADVLRLHDTKEEPAGIRRADSILYPAQPGAGNSAHHQF